MYLHDGAYTLKPERLLPPCAAPDSEHLNTMSLEIFFCPLKSAVTRIKRATGIDQRHHTLLRILHVLENARHALTVGGDPVLIASARNEDIGHALIALPVLERRLDPLGYGRPHFAELVSLDELDRRALERIQLNDSVHVALMSAEPAALVGIVMTKLPAVMV